MRMTTEELFRLHAPFVARLLHRLGVPPGELDDVVQQVFVVVHKNGGYVSGPATPTSYLGAIAVKAASSARRRDGAQRSRYAGYSPELLASSGRDPVSLLETRSELTQLQAALDQMDADLRVVLVLTELEGESCASIAASQGIPVGTVYWRAHRARKQFRQLARRLSDDARMQSAPKVGHHAAPAAEPDDTTATKPESKAP
ncbi:MAG: sigma-70 family RNA polymerase sigma factor [Polyangiales bacterium]